MPTELPDNAEQIVPRSSDDPSRRSDGIPPGKQPHDAWKNDRSATSPQSDPDIHDGNARPTTGKD